MHCTNKSIITNCVADNGVFYLFNPTCVRHRFSWIFTHQIQCSLTLYLSIKLASNNYLLWKAQVIPVLHGHGLLGYVQNTITYPPATIIDEDGVSCSNLAAFHTAVFLINRLPTSTLGLKSSYELVFGSPPSYDLLRIFGCACYPWLTPFGWSKLDYKSTRCVFLGYSIHHRGYQCLDIKSGRILYLSRHVIFDELTFPFMCQQGSTKSNLHSFKVRALP